MGRWLAEGSVGAGRVNSKRLRVALPCQRRHRFPRGGLRKVYSWGCPSGWPVGAWGCWPAHLPGVQQRSRHLLPCPPPSPNPCTPSQRLHRQPVCSLCGPVPRSDVAGGRVVAALGEGATTPGADAGRHEEGRPVVCIASEPRLPAATPGVACSRRTLPSPHSPPPPPLPPPPAAPADGQLEDLRGDGGRLLCVRHGRPPLHQVVPLVRGAQAGDAQQLARAADVVRCRGGAGRRVVVRRGGGRRRGAGLAAAAAA